MSKWEWRPRPRKPKKCRTCGVELPVYREFHRPPEYCGDFCRKTGTAKREQQAALDRRRRPAALNLGEDVLLELNGGGQ